MVLISCAVACCNSVSYESKFFLSRCFADTFPIGEQLVVKMADGVSLPCRLVQSLPGEEISRLDVSPLLAMYVSQTPLHVDLRVLPFRLYMLPLAKNVVLTVPWAFRNKISPSNLKNLLHGQIVSENQHLSCSTACPPSNEDNIQKGVHLVVKKVCESSNSEIEGQYMSMYKISRCCSQILLVPERSGFDENVPRNLTTVAYGDIHATLRGFIRDGLKDHINSSDGIARNTSSNTTSSVLLVGISGSAQSQIILTEAEAAAVPVLKMTPSLLQLEESNVTELLNMCLLSALLRQPCIILIEMIELFEKTKHANVMKHECKCSRCLLKDRRYLWKFILL